MRIKSFYAGTVETAVADARREFGEDAMLVESRRAPLEARHLGEYEVVCAQIGPSETPVPEPVPAPHEGRLAGELAEMRRQLDLMGKTISRAAWSSMPGTPYSPELSDWHSRMLAADVEGEILHLILESARNRAALDGAGFERALAEEMEERILVNGELAPLRADSPRCAALVGPPGAGKTTMIAKLAVTCGLAARRPVLLFSMDDYRVAGADQLRAYATILGVGFQAFDSVSALGLALAEHRGRHFILIDTPGYGPRDLNRAAGLAGFLSSHPDISTHLVLTASMKSADLIHVAERFEIFRPSSLLFTRLDETGSFGTAFSLSVRLGRPISFLGTGQDIPEDLEPATKPAILSYLGMTGAVPTRRAA